MYRGFTRNGKSVQEILEQLPEDQQKNIKILLQTNDLDKLLDAATKLKELLKEEFNMNLEDEFKKDAL